MLLYLSSLFFIFYFIFSFLFLCVWFIGAATAMTNVPLGINKVYIYLSILRLIGGRLGLVVLTGLHTRLPPHAETSQGNQPNEIIYQRWACLDTPIHNPPPTSTEDAPR